jgi:hypothetical protein
MIYRWFTDPDERNHFPVEDHEVQSRRYAALLRRFTTLAEVDAGSGPTSS